MHAAGCTGGAASDALMSARAAARAAVVAMHAASGLAWQAGHTEAARALRAAEAAGTAAVHQLDAAGARNVGRAPAPGASTRRGGCRRRGQAKEKDPVESDASIGTASAAVHVARDMADERKAEAFDIYEPGVHIGVQTLRSLVVRSNQRSYETGALRTSDHLRSPCGSEQRACAHATISMV